MFRFIQVILIITGSTFIFANQNEVFADEQETARALKKEITAIIPKSNIAPSKDPHDYYSLSPYMWPDPNKPDGLPYIYKDGQFNPERSSYDQPKFVRFIRIVSVLTKAYEDSKDLKYAKRAIEWVETWMINENTKMNPHMNYAQTRPGIDKLSPSGIIEARDLVTLIDSLRSLEETQALSRSQIKSVKEWFGLFLKWLIESPQGIKERASKNNHGIWYDLTAATIAEFIGDNKVTLEILQNFGSVRIANQIAPDGSQPLETKRTRAWHYSIFNLQPAFELARLAKNQKIDIFNYQSSNGASLKKAIDWLIPFGTCKQEFPYQQIDKPDMEQFKALLSQAIDAWNDPTHIEALKHICQLKVKPL
jgi:hypothetical protein